jgi:hypothetical protein
MMTTPRVTETPLAMAAVEPDSFIESSRTPDAKRRLAEREARERRTELVRRDLRVRAADTPKQ